MSTTTGGIARDVIATVTTKLLELDQQIAATGRELQAAENNTAPPAEVLARFNAWVDETAAHTMREYGDQLVSRFGAPAGRHWSSSGSPWLPGDAVEWRFLALFAGDLVKASFAELVHATAYTPGPATPERAGVIARLTEALATLEQAREHLVDELATAGIVVAHTDKVVHRRVQERTQADRVARAAAAQAEQQRQVDAHHRHATGGSGRVIGGMVRPNE